MHRTIYLHGALGETFGREFRLSVDTPAEAVRALCSQLSGFQQYLDGKYFQVFRGAEVDGRDQDPQELHIAFSDDERELHIVPRAMGAKRNGLGKIILGGLLIAASFFIPGSWAIAGEAVAGLVFNVGASMALGGIAQVLGGQAVTSDYDNRDQPKSELFGNALNVSTPGVAVPVLVGMCEVGSVVISSAIHVEDRVTAGAAWAGVSDSILGGFAFD